jgi:hypothetical protein
LRRLREAASTGGRDGKLTVDALCVAKDVRTCTTLETELALTEVAWWHAGHLRQGTEAWIAEALLGSGSETFVVSSSGEVLHSRVSAAVLPTVLDEALGSGARR